MLCRVGLSLRGGGSNITHTPFSLPIPNVLCQTFGMRKAFAIMFIVLGCLFGAISLWSGSGLLTDTTTTDTVIADCKKEVSNRQYSRESGASKSEAMERCVEDGWKALSMVGPFYLIGFVFFGIFSLLFLFIGRRLYRKPKN